MKIALDLDGTAWDNVKFFSELMRGMQARGHHVGILTAHNGAKLKDPDLRLWRARGFPKPDFYIAKTPDEAKIPSREWKTKKVDKYGIDYLFDDFDTGTIELYSRKK